MLKKNMKVGSNIKIISLFIFCLFFNSLSANDKISTAPLINLDQIKPSFEEVDEKNDNKTSDKMIKNKTGKKSLLPASHAILIGLDKITAKSSKIIVNLDEVKKFGPLEIKILKCGKVKLNNKIDDVAYMQVKDLTKSENEKVFIFNGWTFSSDPNLTPFDHAIYDLQLESCFNV
tara:strand:- start:390 stop:914 length:525 start_codon:yes stop_codon:yes gene_type:complete